jgi:hypothetical protein
MTTDWTEYIATLSERERQRIERQRREAWSEYYTDADTADKPKRRTRRSR